MASIAKEQFNRPTLPGHVDETTIFGEKSKSLD